MRVVKSSETLGYDDLYTKRYEFRLCGGSIDPKDVEATAMNPAEDLTDDVKKVAQSVSVA